MKIKNNCLLVFVLMLLLFPITSLAGPEMDGRQTIYYPNQTNYTMLDSMVIPNGSDSIWLDNVLRAATNKAADQGFAYSNSKVDLLNTNYEWVYTIETPSHGITQTSWDFGSTFNLFYTSPNEAIYIPWADNDYAALGIYGDANNSTTNYLKNSVAIEFDNWNDSLVWDDLQNTSRGTHAAITFPENVPNGSRLKHFAFQNLPKPYGSRDKSTIKITWELISEGNSLLVEDNVFRLSYSYYQGLANATNNYPVTGYYDFSYKELIEKFLDPTDMRFGISASTAALVDQRQDMQWVQSYNYSINYYYMSTTGQKTEISLASPRIGSAPAGEFDAGPILPEYLGISSGFRLATDLSQTRNQTISSTSPNIFNYYYEQIPRSITIEKLDAQTKSAMSGIEFTLKDDAGSDPRTVVTGENGLDILENLFRYKEDATTVRTYTLTEKTPDGYLPIEAIEFSVNEDGAIQTSEGTVIPDGGTLQILNEPYGSIRLNKTDTTDPSTKIPMVGIGFQLERLNGENYEIFGDPKTSDTNGQILWEKLPYGTYRIVESNPPEGYNPLNQSPTVTIDGDNRNPIVSLQNQKTPSMPGTGGYGPIAYQAIGMVGLLLGFRTILGKKERTR